MATLQLGGRVPTPVVPEIRRTVLIRSAWGLPWIQAGYLEPIEAERTAAPTISRATLKWDVGEIAPEDATSFGIYTPVNLQEWFARILVHTAAGTFTAFTGIILNERYNDYAVTGGVPHGTQMIEVEGLEYLLKRGRVQGSYVETGLFIERTMTFNRRHTFGTSLSGNRSAEVGPDGVYVFARDGAVWSHLDILEYVLAYYQPAGVYFELSGQLAPLASMYGQYDFRGRDVFDVLNTLIDRSRGLGWRINVVNETAYIDVYSVSANYINLGDFTLPANPRQVLIGAVSSNTFKTSVEIARTHPYSRVIVIGAPVKVMLSASVANGTLERGWSQTEEDAYNAADDNERATDKFAHVYTKLRIPLDWDWTYNRLDGGGGAIANPHHTLDGYLVPGSQGAFINMDKRLEAELPLFEPAVGDTAEPAPRRLFAVVENPEEPGKYIYVDRLASLPGYTSCRVDVSRREMALYINGRANHAMGLGTFDEADPEPEASEFLPEADYRTAIATVAVLTDVHAKVVASIPANWNSNASRDLVILRDNVEIWYAAPGTVEDVTDGDLVFYNGGAGAVIRDDSDELRAIAAAAAAWYGPRRNKQTIEITGMTNAFGVGTLMRATATQALSFVPVGTVVSREHFDFKTNRVTVQTGYAELEFDGVLG